MVNSALTNSNDTASGSPTVSIIVVTYNHEAFIDECLTSCLLQRESFPDIEIVVADDGSSDDTPKLIEAWAMKAPGVVQPVLSPVNTGIAHNFNRGLTAARGDLIAWLGGDDIMLAGKIARQVELLRCQPDASGCYHDAEVFSWPSGKTLGLFSDLYAGMAAMAAFVDAGRMLDPRYQMLPSTVMVRRERLPRQFDTRLAFHNDYLFDLETIIRGGPYFRMEGTYTRYRKHEKSIGLDPATRAVMLEENLIVTAIAEARYPHLSRQIKRRAIYYLTLEALKSLREHDTQRFRALCVAIFARGAWVRAAGLRVFGRFLSRLTDQRHRRLALRLRSLFG